jgi:hypothetical protein
MLSEKALALCAQVQKETDSENLLRLIADLLKVLDHEQTDAMPIAPLPSESEPCP